MNLRPIKMILPAICGALLLPTTARTAETNPGIDCAQVSWRCIDSIHGSNPQCTYQEEPIDCPESCANIRCPRLGHSSSVICYESADIAQTCNVFETSCDDFTPHADVNVTSCVPAQEGFYIPAGDLESIGTIDQDPSVRCSSGATAQRGSAALPMLLLLAASSFLQRRRRRTA